MSILLDYVSTTDATTGSNFGLRSGTVVQRQPLYLDPNKRKAFRIIRVRMSSEMPNVYNYGGINTTKIKMTKDGGVTWDTCLLSPGVYTVSMLNEAINNVGTQAGYWADDTQPGFDLNYNPATDLVYITVDSTKLAVANQLGIDFSSGGTSLMYQMLGYTLANAIIVTDSSTGVSATLPPQLDWQGTYVDFYISCIQNTRWVAGQLSSVVCRVPITSESDEIVWPASNTGMISPIIPAAIPSVIQSWDVRMINGRGREAVWLFGTVAIETEIIDLKTNEIPTF